MHRRVSSSDSGGGGGGGHRQRESSQDGVISTIRSKPPRIYDNITRRLLQLGVTLAITTFIGLIIRYAVQEFDPTVSTITVTTSKINNRDIASLSVSKHFLERILEFVEESIAIVAAIIPLGFPICTIFNKCFAKIRAGGPERIEIKDDRVLSMIPKYIVIGDAQACQMPNSTRLRPLVRGSVYQLIKAHLKPKLIVEESYEDARKLGIRIGLIRRDHHKLAVMKSVDLLKYITDSHGDIKQEKVRYVLSRMKIMSQSTPADKSMLIYLMKHCEPMPNENLAYLGYSFTDPEAMKTSDGALTFQDCDDEDVKKNAQVLLKSENMTFTDLYLFLIVCLLASNIRQSYALYQISASVSCCIYRFLSITVFQEQIVSHSQFTLLVILQQVFAIIALMTKWLSSLPRAPIKSSVVADMSHATSEDFVERAVSSSGGSNGRLNYNHHPSSSKSKSPRRPSRSGRDHHRSMASISGQESSSIYPSDNQYNTATNIRMQQLNQNNGENDDTLNSSPDLEDSDAYDSDGDGGENDGHRSYGDLSTGGGVSSLRHTNRQSRSQRRRHKQDDEPNVHPSGIDFDEAIINSKLVIQYKQTFRNSSLIDDVTYRLAKLHIAYQVLVMIIIMIFGNAMFQLNSANNKQHQTLAFNSLMMNNIFNLCNCFNQFGKFNLKSGFKNHPFFVCILLMAVFAQVIISELNAFGLENLNPTQWFVCFVFAGLSALISPLTGQQRRGQRRPVHSGVAHHHGHYLSSDVASGYHYKTTGDVMAPPHKQATSGRSPRRVNQQRDQRHQHRRQKHHPSGPTTSKSQTSLEP